MVTIGSLAIAGVANRKQSLVLSSGGGGNRKPRIPMRIQVQGITGNPIPKHRNQNTRKCTFGNPFRQVAKSNTTRRREGQTWGRLQEAILMQC
jgi:hypothetical protein